MSPDIETKILVQLRSISERLDALEHQLQRPMRTWLAPAEMSRLAGVSTRTLQNYVSSGRISRASYKKEARGSSFTYRYHQELTLHDLGIKD